MAQNSRKNNQLILYDLSRFQEHIVTTSLRLRI